MVSNAGIMVRKPLRRLTLPEWHRVLDTNLTAAFLLARAAEKALRNARGAIVTVASTRALMSEPNTESYSASKGARCARSPTRSRSALPPTCASIASAPAGARQVLQAKSLICPTALKRAIARKGQFRKLSNRLTAIKLSGGTFQCDQGCLF